MQQFLDCPTLVPKMGTAGGSFEECAFIVSVNYACLSPVVCY